MDLDLASLTLGNHYKIIATHSIKPTEPGGSFWQRESVPTLIKEDGPSKKNTAKPSHSRSALFSHSSNSSETNHDSALPWELEFRRRKEHSDNQQEIIRDLFEDETKEAQRAIDLVQNCRIC